MVFYKRIQSYFQGYVRICVEGYFIERFINFCTAQKILLWDVERENSSMLHTNIGKEDFKRLKKVAKKTKCKVKLEKKKGIPFTIHRYQKRKLFFAFLLLDIVVLFQMSGFVWNIEIKGNEKIESKEILQNLQEKGLVIGKRKSKVDTKKIINAIRLERNDLAWIGIDLEGTNAIVKVVEADSKPEIIKEEEYCNIVSEKEGEIVKVDARNRYSISGTGRYCTKR